MILFFPVRKKFHELREGGLLSFYRANFFIVRGPSMLLFRFCISFEAWYDTEDIPEFFSIMQFV